MGRKLQFVLKSATAIHFFVFLSLNRKVTYNKGVKEKFQDLQFRWRLFAVQAVLLHSLQIGAFHDTAHQPRA